jgi:uncharacterized protein (TIGR02598 family)
MKTAASSSYGCAVAFSVVEVAIALAIASFCLVAIFGLLPVGLASNQISTEQTAAANIVRGIVADLEATGTNSTVSAVYAVNMSSGTSTLFFSESGKIESNAGAARCRARIFIDPPASGSKGITNVRIVMTWPAPVDPALINPPGSYEAFTALDRN